MIDILESVRRVVYRWVNTTVALTQDAPYNTTTLKVRSTRRFKAGDEVAIHNGIDGEPHLRVGAIIDDNTLELESPIQVMAGWRVSANAMLTKTFNGQFVQGIYINDPDVIPAYPAITITGKTRNSEWITLSTTKERYSLELAIYVQADNDETSYRTLLQLTDIIQLGLKKNIFPLVGPYSTVPITADVVGGDNYIKVANSSVFVPDEKLIIENIYQAEELRLCCITDPTTIQVYPNVYNDYKVSDGAKMIRYNRHIYNSWPAEINYGYKLKESLLHASTINWFAEEQEPQRRHGWSDPQLS